MDAYIYQADLYCESCTKETKKTLPFPDYGIPGDEYSFDSDDYPKGPFSNGGGETDSPQHCGRCHVFLKNPLTSDGYDYVKEACQEKGEVTKQWAEFYLEELI